MTAPDPCCVDMPGRIVHWSVVGDPHDLTACGITHDTVKLDIDVGTTAARAVTCPACIGHARSDGALP